MCVPGGVAAWVVECECRQLGGETKKRASVDTDSDWKTVQVSGHIPREEKEVKAQVESTRVPLMSFEEMISTTTSAPSASWNSNTSWRCFDVGAGPFAFSCGYRIVPLISSAHVWGPSTRIIRTRTFLCRNIHVYSPSNKDRWTTPRIIVAGSPTKRSCSGGKNEEE